MGTTRVVFSRVAALVVVTGIVLLPQAATGRDDGLPEGSWRQSCEKGYVRDGTLHAQCTRGNGQQTSATAEIGDCRAFGNRNGTLFCETGADDDGTADKWSGSFRDSCRDASVDKHGRLQATCLKNNGTHKRSNLRAENCPGFRAGNRDGRLFCEPGDSSGGHPSRWDGSFRNSCRDVATDTKGRLTAECQTSSGSWRRSSLSVSDCSSHRAGNREGQLYCESGVGRGGHAAQWDGSFRNSCRDVATDSNGRLTAECQTSSGTWRRSSLSLSDCTTHRAGNREGKLFCESRAEAAARP